MSAKNFMSNGDAETVFTAFANVIKDKQDKYETITYAQWQQLTPAQQAAKDYYISDYPSSVLTAGNIAYDNTSSGMAANKVQGAIDELKSGLDDLPYSIRLTGTETTSNTGIITVNTGKTLTDRKVVAVSNFGADNSTPYMAFVEAFVAGGTVSLRIRKYTDGTAVINTAIDMSKIVLIVA